MGLFNQNHLSESETRTRTPLSTEFLNTVCSLLRNLARHFRAELDETSLLTYLQGLRDLRIDKIKLACESAIKRSRRMPFVADLREFANEQSTGAIYGTQSSLGKSEGSAYFLSVREIAIEITPKLIGREYHTLETHREDSLIFEAMRHAALVGYMRRGIDPAKWLGQSIELSNLRLRFA